MGAFGRWEQRVQWCVGGFHLVSVHRHSSRCSGIVERGWSVSLRALRTFDTARLYEPWTRLVKRRWWRGAIGCGCIVPLTSSVHRLVPARKRGGARAVCRALSHVMQSAPHTAATWLAHARAVDGALARGHAGGVLRQTFKTEVPGRNGASRRTFASNLRKNRRKHALCTSRRSIASIRSCERPGLSRPTFSLR
jgi:hypothetical protein